MTPDPDYDLPYWQYDEVERWSWKFTDAPIFDATVCHWLKFNPATRRFKAERQVKRAISRIFSSEMRWHNDGQLSEDQVAALRNRLPPEEIAACMRAATESSKLKP